MLPNFQATPLLPAVAQDSETGRVLMLAWMNREAWEETIQSGYATYYSRSRQRLWRKGEESGHRQEIVAIQVDCDGDTILLKVKQHGPACHECYESCFFRTWNGSEWIVTEERLQDPDSVYTSH